MIDSMVKAVGGVVIALVLALSGCGGDDGEPETVTVTTPAEAPDKGTPTTPSAEADKKRANAALLTLDDFPSGWTANDDDDEDEDDPEESPCKEIRDAKGAVNARATSPTFAEDESVGVDQTVYIYASESEAQSHYAALTTGPVRSCIGQSIADRLAKNADEVEASGAEFKDPQTAELRVEPVGSESAALRVTVPYTSEIVDGEVVLDGVFIRVGRGISLFTIYSDFSSPDDDQRDDLAGTAARRLNQALDGGS